MTSIELGHYIDITEESKQKATTVVEAMSSQGVCTCRVCYRIE